jgi:Na+/H+ antiporter NhaC
MNTPTTPPVTRRRPHRRRGWVALLPLLLLALLTAGSGWLLGDFGRVPMTVVFLLTGIAALATLRGYRMTDRMAVFSRGAGHSDLLMMVWIFILAGAFAQSAKAMGAITATVDLTLYCIPEEALPAGLFIAACLVSLCIGTSVGTIVALVPVATEMAQRTATATPLMVAACIGGALFGDNLSVISDTSIAATTTQGCLPSEKFRHNFKIVWPAALCCILVYAFSGSNGYGVAPTATELQPLRILPYVVVLVLAMCQCHVALVLCLGSLLTGMMGLAEGTLTPASWLTAMGNGIAGMGDLILISLMAGGLLAVVREGGGLTWVVRLLTRRITRRRGAEGCIAALVALTNCCTANNTVAILSVASIAKDIGERYALPHRRTASLLDIVSCSVQGLLPYGAQVLMAAGLAAVSPIALLPFLYYPLLLALSAVVSILVGRPRH